MDNIKLAQHEIEAAKIWREAGDVDRALQHLEYALGYLQDEQAAEQCVEADEGDSPDEEEFTNPYLLTASEIDRTLALHRSR